jgi:hypothetical protein
VIGLDLRRWFIGINAVGHGAGLPSAIDQVIKNGAAIGVPVLQINDPLRQHDFGLLDVPVAPVVEKNRLAMVAQPELEADVTRGLSALFIWLNVHTRLSSNLSDMRTEQTPDAVA